VAPAASEERTARRATLDPKATRRRVSATRAGGGEEHE